MTKGQFTLGAAAGSLYNEYMGVRYFSGTRDKGRMGVASEIMRLEILKKGKLPSTERYKSILKKKFQENKQKTLTEKLKQPIIPGLAGLATAKYSMSKRAEQALQQIAQRKAKKEAKAQRSMVIVEARRFPNGNLTNKGKIYDVAGNLVAEVNRKTGRMATTNGWGLGKYRPKSYFTNLTIQSAIDQHSPYYINLRKQQLMQQQNGMAVTAHGAPDVSVINVWGAAPETPLNSYGSDPVSPRQNVTMTAWGVRSDNAWGTFADNSWGTFADNVWGGNYSDVWGGIGGGGLWGQKGPNVWGTGNGRNYLRGVTNFLAGLFGLTDKKNRQNLQRLNKGARAAAAPSRAPTSARTSR